MKTADYFGRMVVALGLGVVLAACGDDLTGPEGQVIEEVTFAASLNVDLSAMRRLESGVYLQDLIIGDGDTVVFGSTPFFTFTGWLIDGTVFSSGLDTFLMGNNRTLIGIEDGVVGMKVGGKRRIIIPPSRGYGFAQGGPIPAGSVLIFDMMADSVQGGI